MTREEAIKELELMKSEVEWEYSISYAAAIETAINELSKEAVWIYNPVMLDYTCSYCGLFTTFGSESFSYRYCPICGAKINLDRLEELS